MLELIAKIPAWIVQYGPTAELIIQGLEEQAKRLTGAERAGLAIPSISKLRDALDLMMLKNLTARKMSESGLISESDASSIVEKDIQSLSTTAAGKTGAGGAILAGIANWLVTNGPKLAASIATMIQTLMPVILALFAGGA